MRRFLAGSSELDGLPSNTYWEFAVAGRKASFDEKING
jgi:hypothetical protein